MIVASRAPARTRELGSIMGSVVGPGDVIVVDGELGAGKTTFVQGVGEAMGVREPVTSPTFVLVREHVGLNGVLVHADAYRLTDSREWDDLDVDLGGSICVIEWGGLISDALPEDKLSVKIQGDGSSRTLFFSAGGSLSADLLARFEAGL